VFGTGLFSVGCSPIQNTVVTIFVFHGYRSVLVRDDVGTKTCGSTFIMACSRSFIAYFAKSALLS
jgi:hypothetical protein